MDTFKCCNTSLISSTITVDTWYKGWITINIYIYVYSSFEDRDGHCNSITG
jgi:hypothetical protein